MITEDRSGIREQEQVIFEAVSVIDTWLIRENVKLNLRPFEAAVLFVEHFIVGISGASKENYEQQKWFAILYRHVKDWYVQNYGSQIEDPASHAVYAAVLIRGIPVPFEVPLTRCIVEEEGKTTWLCFLGSVQEDESPVLWLKNPPPLKMLPPKDIDRIEVVCKRISTALRKIYYYTKGISGVSEELIGFTASILPDLETSANHIIKNNREDFCLAAWSIQMALEKTMKALSLQKKGQYKQSHDLFLLFDFLGSALDSSKRNNLKKFLREKEVMSARYGTCKSVDQASTFESYLAAIEFIAYVTEKLERDFTRANLRILLKKPPWLEI